MSPTDDTFTDALLAQTTWLRRLVGGLLRDPDAADDVYQTTLLQALRFRPSEHAGGGGIRPWLATVARRLAGEHRRRGQERQSHEASAMRMVGERGNAPSTSDVVERVAWQQTIVAAVMALDEPYRTTLLLRYWEDLPPREVAARLGVPVETVRTRTKRGLARLRERLDAECGDRATWVTALAPFAPSVGLGAGISTTSLASFVVILMQKKLMTLGVLALVCASIWFVDPFGARHAPATLDVAGQGVAIATDDSDFAPEPAPRSNDATRIAIEEAPAHEPASVDPAIAAAMCGFRGRILDGGVPVVGCGVRIHRLTIEQAIAEGGRAFETPSAPSFEHVDATTDRHGVFELDGVWPNGFYIAHIGRGTEHPTHRVLQATPGPGEVIDLGDLELVHGATLTGRVVGPDGTPLPGAHITIGELPAELLLATPLERFDPNGHLMFRMPNRMHSVVEVPRWLAALHDELPLGRARSASDGTFRIVGVAAGQATVLVRAPGLEGLRRTELRLRADETRDLGELRLSEGAELSGIVIDSRSQPIAGVEVVAASTSIAPIDFGSRVGITGEDGTFRATGFARGLVHVAVRRDSESAWTSLELQSIDDDVVVRLPDLSSLSLTACDEAGRRIEGDVEIELQQGFAATAPTLRRFDAGRPIPAHFVATPDGDLRAEGVECGDYVVTVRAEGYAPAQVELRVDAENAGITHEVRLARARTLEVIVRSLADHTPIRNVAIYALGVESDGTSESQMPTHCGLTDASGTLRTHPPAGERLVIVASHPAFGMVETLVPADDHTVVQLQLHAPGSIEGRITSDARPIAPGSIALRIVREVDEPLGVLTSQPRLVTPRTDGSFVSRGWQAGRYRVTPIRTLEEAPTLGYLTRLDALGEPAVIGMSFLVEIPERPPHVARLDFDMDGTREVQGLASVQGTLRINGAPAADFLVVARELPPTADRDRRVHTAADGRFAFVNVPAAGIWLQVLEPGDAGKRAPQAIWDTFFELLPDERRELAIDVTAARIAGHVVGDDGAPVANAQVTLLGDPSDPDATPISLELTTDDDGRFEQPILPVGTYALRARTSGRAGAGPIRVSRSQRIEVRAGESHTDSVLTVTMPRRVAGTIDLSVLPIGDGYAPTLVAYRQEQPSDDLTWLEAVARSNVDARGAFAFDDLAPGRFRLDLTLASGAVAASRWLDVDTLDRLDLIYEELEADATSSHADAPQPDGATQRVESTRR